MSVNLELLQVTNSDAEATPVSIQPSGRAFVLGRGNDVDLFLPDPTASRRHCAIEWVSGKPHLTDLGSRVGTRRNGEVIGEAVALASGDEIAIGELRFRVTFREDASVGSGEMEAVGPANRDDETVMPESPVLTGAAEPVDQNDRTILSEGGESGRTEQSDLNIPIGTSGIMIGRDATCDVTLPSPMVSRQHVKLERIAGVVVIEDIQSANGTYINGARLRGSSRLNAGEIVRIGPYELLFDGAVLVSHRTVGGTRIELRSIGKQVNDRETGRPIWLLRDINFTVMPGEFVGVFGSSGCGKSTLLDAVNGRRPAGTGAVLYNGQNLYNNFGSFKTGIGHVPQDLVLHEQLAVVDALRFAARLRLPADTSNREIAENIDRVLGLVGLDTRRNVRIDYLSGGQKKRVSIAMELLGRPTILFLDEATSGLDLVTEGEMMQIFRNLADAGVTTFCITHHAHSLSMCDLLIYLMAGRLVYAGPPSELKRFFGVNEIRDVYLKEKERSPEEWEARFRASQIYSTCVTGRADQSAEERETQIKPGQAVAKVDAENSIRQFKLLCSRYVRILRNDRRQVLLLLALAPVIALIPRLRLPPESNVSFDDAEVARQTVLCFSAGLSAFFLGIFGAIREVVREDNLYRHERFLNLEIVPYLASKIVPLATINVVQAALLLMCFTAGDGLKLSGFIANAVAFVTLFLTALVGSLLGLAISSAVRNASQAMMIMIVVIMPQVLFNGALQPPLHDTTKTAAEWLAPGYSAYDLLHHTVDPNFQVHLPPTEARPAPQLTVGVVTWGMAMLVFNFCFVYLIAAIYFLKRKDGPYGKLYAIPILRSGLTAVALVSYRWLANKVTGRLQSSTSVPRSGGG